MRCSFNNKLGLDNTNSRMFNNKLGSLFLNFLIENNIYYGVSRSGSWDMAKERYRSFLALANRNCMRIRMTKITHSVQFEVACRYKIS